MTVSRWAGGGGGGAGQTSCSWRGEVGGAQVVHLEVWTEQEYSATVSSMMETSTPWQLFLSPSWRGAAEETGQSSLNTHSRYCIHIHVSASSSL